MPRKLFKCFLVLFLVLFLFILLNLLFGDPAEVFHDEFYIHDIPENGGGAHKETYEDVSNKTITEPIILWWTPFTGDKGLYRKCGMVSCFFTVNRNYKDHEKIKAFLFYGTDFKGHDLPVPRLKHHEWGLLHEESPKNNYLFSYAEVMELFNHTGTFRRESHYPIPTQYVHSAEWLEDKKYFVPTKDKNSYLSELSPIIYTQSDCEVPSGRDEYTKLLMQYIKVDSYGKCLHNKDLPESLRDPIEGMDHKEFFKLNAKYKFSLAMENGICPDYMTEKLWRPFHIGSVPIILGSPKVKDYLPSNHSAIVVDDFDTVEELANYIKYLNENDKEYEKYLQWKKTGISNSYLKKQLKEREWGLQNEWGREEINFIEGFQCHVCKQIHKNIQREKKGQEALKFQANVDHYGCPGPISFDSSGRRQEGGTGFDYEFRKSKYLAVAINKLVNSGKYFTKKDLLKLANEIKDELR